jgi:hypothetical protein
MGHGKQGKTPFWDLALIFLLPMSGSFGMGFPLVNSTESGVESNRSRFLKVVDAVRALAFEGRRRNQPTTPMNLKKEISPRLWLTSMAVWVRSVCSVQLLPLLLLAVFPATGLGQDFLFTTEAGTITIQGRTSRTSTAVSIPALIDGRPVTAIAPDAFVGDTMMSVTIPFFVTTIGNAAFYGCTNLTSVLLGRNLTTIGGFAFGNCSSLTDISVPGKATQIQPSAFVECHGLTNFTVDTTNPAYSSRDGVLFNMAQTTLVRFPAGKGTRYTIPDRVTAIEAGAFSDCSALTHITISDSVTAIAGQTFSNCSQLTEVRIGNAVKAIGDNAFSGCSALRTLTIPDSVVTIGRDAFQACYGLRACTKTPTLAVQR